MSGPNFTPGPWEAQRLDADDHDTMAKYVDATIRVGGTQYFLVMGAHDDGRPADVAHTGNGPRSAANARLIAAAPDLYAALLDVAQWIEQTQTRDDEGAQGELRQIRAALAKAVEP